MIDGEANKDNKTDIKRKGGEQVPPQKPQKPEPKPAKKTFIEKPVPRGPRPPREEK